MPTFDDLETVLQQAGSKSAASKAHGSLCGFACVLGGGARGAWRAELMADLDPAVAAGSDHELLDSLFDATSAALEEGDMTFQPILPGDLEQLERRAECLAEWCDAFNGALVAAADIGDAEAQIADGVTLEILRDFSEMARVGLAADEDLDEAEAAYTELVEYVRVSVQLIYEELSGVRERLMTAGVH